jgi:hypothetical protein
VKKVIKDRDGKKWKLSGSSLKKVWEPVTGQRLGYRSGKYLYDDHDNVIGEVRRSKLNELLKR